jgi:elongation factor Ts
MTAVTSSSISELRERTGAGIVDCKKALQEADGSLDKAVEILRQKGIASAAKKAGRVAAEGAVVAKVSQDGKTGVLLELNCQTDFVAKNDKFHALLNEILDLVLSSNAKTIDEVFSLKVQTGDLVKDHVALKSAEIGEKLDLRRIVKYNASTDQNIGFYTHPVGSKIAVLVLTNKGDAQLGKDLAMHIAASQPAPEFVTRDEIPAEAIENEKRIELGKADLSNKPKDIAEKIVAGRVDKALMEKVLLEQPFIKNPSVKVKEQLAQSGASILSFARFNLGEGIEKQESNFAEEVAAQMKG